MSHNSSDDRAKRKRAEDRSSGSQSDSCSEESKKKHKHDRSSVKKKRKKEKRKKSSSKETKKKNHTNVIKLRAKQSPILKTLLVMIFLILRNYEFVLGPTITVSAAAEATPQQPITAQRYLICLLLFHSVGCDQYLVSGHWDR